MTQTKFTPGPWEFNEDECLVTAKSDTWEICGFADRSDPHDDDAHLIAAAPELYEALEEVLDAIGALSKPHELNGYGLTDGDVRQIFSALAKARGEA